MRARRPAATTTALLATLALAGCGLQKPSPYVTLYSGGTAVNAMAQIWCFEGEDAGCAELDSEVPQLPVAEGRVAFDVGSEVAERGWYVVPAGQQAEAPEIQHDGYVVFPGIQLPPEGLPIEVVVTDGEGGAGERTGLYRFQLVPAE